MIQRDRQISVRLQTKTNHFDKRDFRTFVKSLLVIKSTTFKRLKWNKRFSRLLYSVSPTSCHTIGRASGACVTHSHPCALQLVLCNCYHHRFQHRCIMIAGPFVLSALLASSPLRRVSLDFCNRAFSTFRVRLLRKGLRHFWYFVNPLKNASYVLLRLWVL